MNDYKKYNPFKVKRSAGLVRIFLPMFGLLGLDYGFGFDSDPGAAGEVNHNAQINANGYRGQFHFTIGMNIGEFNSMKYFLSIAPFFISFRPPIL